MCNRSQPFVCGAAATVRQDRLNRSEKSLKTLNLAARRQWERQVEDFKKVVAFKKVDDFKKVDASKKIDIAKKSPSLAAKHRPETPARQSASHRRSRPGPKLSGKRNAARTSFEPAHRAMHQYRKG
jgi:hypothetical protein